VLIFENVNAVLYLKRSAAANSVFGPKRIKASLAGRFSIVALCGDAHVIVFAQVQSAAMLSWLPQRMKECVIGITMPEP